ncbi:hypothetical protein PUNSTDRAFT_145365 [Punctularia strigosozonata HHB-11173 SS5]|uniref:uncharacterized protein n=1 Tax=Punctularia strigosozonata (strain HHB-11173) TaxID=741275 RepID=UPI0004416E56|nr:uncharacterized protein PUNSTDRAFT_145365 [Punctularia strigosozonata HHB-11173 SS5]EIN05968.1 hypothetical protein PUNSTDRAFT_145365 [Punctularia strigosozonata HHB-11173 SS5]
MERGNEGSALAPLYQGPLVLFSLLTSDSHYLSTHHKGSRLAMETPQNTAKAHESEAEPFPLTNLSRTGSGEDLSSELQVPRKREREISLEPATPQSTTLDMESPGKERRVPVKKNKLDATEEEDPQDNGVVTPPRSRSRSSSGPDVAAELGKSPPIESKVRHISRRVEDITWKDGVPQETCVQVDVQANAGVDTPAVLEAAADIASVPGYVQPETKDIDIPDESQQSIVHEPPQQEQPQNQGSSTDEDEKMERRRSSESITGTKRQREEPDQDANPRETKRPSPPPDENPATPAPAPIPPSTPKLSGFMAYASSSSPFSSVKGAPVFGSTSKPKSTPTFGAPSPFRPAASGTSSPFASGNAVSSPFASGNATPSTSQTESLRPASPKPSTASSLFQKSAFAAFASPSSPFASVTPSRSPSSGPARPKSPVNRSKSPYGDRAKSPSARINAKASGAFASYATGGYIQSLAAASPLAATPKKSRAGTPAEKDPSVKASVLSAGEDEGAQTENEEGEESPKETASFGEKLRAGKDQEDESESERSKVELSEQDVPTGEEEEETVYQVRGKLYTLSPETQWQERGTGMLKLNVLRVDGSSPRLVMRKEAVYSLLLNISLFKGMHFALAQDPRYLRFSALENGKTVHYNLRVSNQKIAEELLEEINANIPGS